MVTDNFNTVFNNTKTFVTGHTGFKGSWLSLWLNQLGSSVTGLSLAPESQSHWNDLRLDSISSNIGDIRDYDFTADNAD